MTDLAAIGAQVSALGFKVVTLPEVAERDAAQALFTKNMAVLRDLQQLHLSGTPERKDEAMKPGAALAAAKNVLGETS